MELTREEKDALRELLGKVRQIAEDFCCVYVNHFLEIAPEHRLRVLQSAMDGGELFLGRLESFVAAVDDRSEPLAVDRSRMTPSGMDSPRGHLRECFYWAAERCLGDEFTPLMRSAHYKMVDIVLTQRALMPHSLQEQMDVDNIPRLQL
jgi:hypothetical protein